MRPIRPTIEDGTIRLFPLASEEFIPGATSA